jgi:hypothetical protein
VKVVYLQEILLRMALEEEGIDPQKISIEVDHKNGTSTIEGVQVGLIYPKSFLKRCEKYISREKKVKFYFKGNMSKSGNRLEMLRKFSKYDSIIIDSNSGRMIEKKGNFDAEYFLVFGSSEFGLCPNQADWDGLPNMAWTYRFVEACMTESIPILFRSAPLGDNFTNGFRFIWDDDAVRIIETTELVYQNEIAERNRLLAAQRFCLSESDIDRILSRSGRVNANY